MGKSGTAKTDNPVSTTRTAAVAVAAVCAALALTAVVASADTVISGNVLVNTTWTTGGSPYIIQISKVEVKNGSTLTIDPGVEVRFQSNTRIVTVSPGSIVAVGALGDSIVFTSDSATPAPGAWHSVGVFASSDSEFRYCKFKYASYGLWLSESDPQIEHCAFEDCQIGLYLKDASPAVEGSWFRYASIYNVWSNSSTEGVSLPTFHNCNLLSSGAINIRLDGYHTAERIVAEFNWWGTADQASIAATIEDDPDGPATVDFNPWLTQVPVGATSWGRIKALFR